MEKGKNEDGETLRHVVYQISQKYNNFSDIQESDPLIIKARKLWREDRRNESQLEIVKHNLNWVVNWAKLGYNRRQIAKAINVNHFAVDTVMKQFSKMHVSSHLNNQS